MKVGINKLMKYPSLASEELGAINFSDDQDIDSCIEEVMMIDEEARIEKLPSEECTLEYAFLDEEKAKPVIISSQLDMLQEEQLLEI